MASQKSTIREAILQMFKDGGKPLIARQVYELIEEQFRVDIEELPIYINALDETLE